jgi:hypothetical protein
MTNQQHPITPPPELVEKWFNDSPIDRGLTLATQAARWGADQELEAGVNYIDNNISGNKAREFRAIRRPKPPSLKEQALKALLHLDHGQHNERCLLIRRALEAE